LRVREDAECNGRGLADLLVLVRQELRDHLLELRVASLGGGVADLRERDHATRDDVVVGLFLQGREERGHDLLADLLLRRLEAVLAGRGATVTEEEAVAPRRLPTLVDLRLQVQVGLLVELPPEAPQRQIRAAVTTTARRGTAAGAAARSAGCACARSRRAGRSRSGRAGGAGRRSRSTTSTSASAARRN